MADLGLMAAVVEQSALARVLVDPTFELIPLKNALEQASHIPAGRTVSITASPGQHDRGHGRPGDRARAGRPARDPAPLGADDPRPRAPRGDPRPPCGRAASIAPSSSAATPTSRASSLTGCRCSAAMADLGKLPRELGCPCYPQGHPDIPDDALLQALRDKAPFVQYMTTQLCFDPKAIEAFIAARRAEGITLPVKLGIPGVAEIPKLLSISARIGVRDASKFVLKNARFVGALLRSGGIYRPTRAHARAGAADRRPRGERARPPRVHVQQRPRHRGVAA